MNNILDKITHELRLISQILSREIPCREVFPGITEPSITQKKKWRDVISYRTKIYMSFFEHNHFKYDQLIKSQFLKYFTEIRLQLEITFTAMETIDNSHPIMDKTIELLDVLEKYILILHNDNKSNESKFEKGIIVSGVPNISTEIGPLAKKIKINDIMFYSLYWDKLIFASPVFTDFIRPNFGSEINSYLTTGFIEKYTYYPEQKTYKSEELHKLSSDALIQCYQDKNKDKPNDYLINYNVNNPSDNISSDDLVNLSTIRLNLANFLPTPSKYTKPENIFKFKEKYKDELNNLHEHLFNYSIKLSEFNDNDPRQAINLYRESHIEKSIKDYRKAFEENFKKFTLKDYIIDLKNNENLFEAGLTFLDNTINPTQLSFKSLYELAKPFINIRSKSQKIHKIMQENPRLHYIGNAFNEGIALPSFDIERK